MKFSDIDATGNTIAFALYTQEPLGPRAVGEFLQSIEVDFAGLMSRQTNTSWSLQLVGVYPGSNLVELFLVTAGGGAGAIFLVRLCDAIVSKSAVATISFLEKLISQGQLDGFQISVDGRVYSLDERTLDLLSTTDASKTRSDGRVLRRYHRIKGMLEGRSEPVRGRIQKSKRPSPPFYGAGDIVLTAYQPNAGAIRVHDQEKAQKIFDQIGGEVFYFLVTLSEMDMQAKPPFTVQVVPLEKDPYTTGLRKP